MSRDEDSQHLANMVKRHMSPKRWVIQEYAELSNADETEYFDLENESWVEDISLATKFREIKSAELVMKNICNTETAKIVPYLLNPNERQPAEYSLSNDRRTIAYDEASQNYLYERSSVLDTDTRAAVIEIKEPTLMICDKDELVSRCLVSIPLSTMDEFAIEWCRYRKLHGALGGPVGNEFGSPDCPWE